MNSNKLSDLLERLNACPEAVEWAQGKDLQTFWDTCSRAGWMLWLVGRMVGVKGWPSRQTVVLAACDCAETALKYVPKGEDRPRKCIETARKWTRGEATIDEVRIAYDAAYASADAVYSDAATSAAAASAIYAAYAADAAFAAVYTAFDAAFSASAGVPQERLVEIVRKRIPVPFKEELK